MFLTIQTLFDDANIVSAIIRRVNQTRKDTIYWQQYLTFRRVTTRVFKDYIGSVTGVMAGSINSRFGEKPIRERRNIGSGYGEIAYLGDAYQMSIDRLSELQDLIDKFNAAKPAEQKAAMEEIVNFLADDYRQITLAAHKRMDIIVGALLMLGEATVYNKDAAITSGQTNNKLLEITLPFNFIKPKKWRCGCGRKEYVYLLFERETSFLGTGLWRLCQDDNDSCIFQQAYSWFI